MVHFITLGALTVISVVIVSFYEKRVRDLKYENEYLIKLLHIRERQIEGYKKFINKTKEL